MVLKIAYILFCIALMLEDLQAASNCKSGWLEFGNSCYNFGSAGMTHDAAKQSCELEDAHLVSIQTSTELDWIIASATGSLFWTSGTKAGDGTWIWDDGTNAPVGFDVVSWAPNTPTGVSDYMIMAISGDFSVMVDSALEPPAICESGIISTAEGAVRVIDGPSLSEGVAQIYVDGAWGYICDGPGFKKAGWPSVFCKDLNGDDSLAIEAIYTRKKDSSIIVEQNAYMAFQNPSCRPSNTAHMIDCGTNANGVTECRRGYRQTVYVTCKPPNK